MVGPDHALHVAMTRRINVYGHRWVFAERTPILGDDSSNHRQSATDGFAFVSLPDSEAPPDWSLEPPSGQSTIEWVETQVFGEFGEDVFGPTPTEVNCAEKQRELDSPIPLEEERDSDTLYKVGELVVTDSDEIVSFDPLDVEEFETVEVEA